MVTAIFHSFFWWKIKILTDKPIFFFKFWCQKWNFSEHFAWKSIKEDYSCPQNNVVKEEFPCLCQFSTFLNRKLLLLGSFSTFFLQKPFLEAKANQICVSISAGTHILWISDKKFQKTSQYMNITLKYSVFLPF